MAISNFKSYTWQFFIKNFDEETALCCMCNKKIQCKGWSTSGLIRHLKNIHNIEKPSTTVESAICGNQSSSTGKRSADDNEPSTSSEKSHKQLKTACFIMKPPSMEETVSKLVAVDRISVNTIARSEFIRQSLMDKGFLLPNTPAAVMDLVYKQYEFIVENIRSEILTDINSGRKFSLTMDEYSSIRNKRYISINVHAPTGKSWNLGMMGIHGKINSETVKEYVELKIGDFGLYLEKDIVCCVTDGTSDMMKFGRQIPCEHHVCYAHSIHLAICDVLYKGKGLSEDHKEEVVEHNDVNESKNETNAEVSEDDGEEDLYSAYITTLDSDKIVNKNLFNIVSVFHKYPNNDDETINIDLSTTFAKVRKIVRLFRKSPLMNEVLQRYVVDEHSQERLLILDTRTRWDSLLAMIERFLELKESIILALLDFKISCDITEYEFEAMQNIKDALLPIKYGSEKLCKRESSLVTAETIFSFIISELSKQRTDFSIRLLNAFIDRLSSRSNQNLTSIALYLSYAKKYCDHRDQRLPELNSKSNIISYSKSVYSRLFDSPQESDPASSEEEIDESKLSLSEKLEQAIKQSTEASVSDSEPKNLHRELEIFEVTAERTNHIKNLYQAIRSVPPASTESGRVFSASGLFHTKLLGHLSHDSINAICMLHAYYKQTTE